MARQQIETVPDFDAGDACPYEATRPLDKPAPVGQRLVDAWRAEHGDEDYPQ